MDRIQKIIFISLFDFYDSLANINKTAVIYDDLNDNIDLITIAIFTGS